MERAYCSTLPFWESLSEENREIFCKSLSRCTYRKGERVQGGEGCRGVIFIRSGCLRVYMLSEEGRDITLYRLYKGDVCMLSASCVLPQITNGAPNNVMKGPAFRTELATAYPALKCPRLFPD